MPKKNISSLNANELSTLIKSKSEEVILAYLGDRFIPNAKTTNGMSLILEAIYYGKVSAAKKLASMVKNLDIFEAAAIGNIKALHRILRSSPEQISAWSIDGFTALQLAVAFSNSPETVKFLLKKGSDVNLKSKNQQIMVKPIHAAVFGGNNDILVLVLDQGADPNEAQDAGEGIPLQEAVMRGSENMVRTLLMYGAERRITTKEGKTLVQLAREKGFQAIERLLEM